METPTLEEVKIMYKGVNKIKSIYSGLDYEIDTEKYGIHLDCNNVRQNRNDKDQALLLYCANVKKYAEIISYKEKNYQLSEKFVKELCKEPNIKEAFVREGIIEETIEIKKSVILNTPNDMELGKLVRTFKK
jgi:hypothetical protein